MGKSGAFATGESKAGGTLTVQTVTLPTTYLGLATTDQSPRGPTGGFKTGEAPTGGTSDEQLPVEAAGAGAASADVPTTEIGFTTPVPTPVYVANLPTTTLGLSTPLPEATGSGVASRTLPTTYLGLLSNPGTRMGFVHWILDGDAVPTRVDEAATHQDLELSFRVETSVLLDVLRSAKVDDDQVDVLATDDGGFAAVDRAGGSNTVELIPPVYRKPLRQQGDYHVTGYGEELVSQDVDEWDVDLETVRNRHREESPEIDETPTGDEWGIDTRLGTISTDRVSSSVLGTGADGVERFELSLTLEMEQARVFESALARVGGARVREIADGSNVAVDETSDDAATVTLEVPGGNEIEDGDYVVFGWEAERQNDRVEVYEVELARKG